MRTKALSISVGVLILSIALSPKAAEACVCSDQVLTDREDAARQFAEAAVVFEGEVIPGSREIVAPSRDSTGLYVIVLRVVRAYKGLHDESVQLLDAMAGSDCAFGQPATGQTYFVYGFKGPDGKIYVQTCTRTSSLESAGPDLRYARGEPATEEDLAPPGEKWRLRRDPSLATQGATLRGGVRRLDGRATTNVFLTVWDVDEEGKRKQSMAALQKVNTDGSYEVRFLPPGHYRITAEDYQVTQTSRFVGDYGNIIVAKSATLAALDVVLHAEPLGNVAVRVVAPRELHDRIFVELSDVEMDSYGTAPYRYSQSARPDDNSIASFDCVPYGHYDVYVGLYDEDVRHPSWIHDEVRVQLNGNKAETVVALRKNPAP